MKIYTKHSYVFIFALSLLFTSCKQQKTDKEEDSIPETTVTEAKAETSTPTITIEKLGGSPAYADAALVLDTPNEVKQPEAGEMDFSFQIQNYELGAITAGPNAEKLANSGKGQHIHFILNNQPYSAHYEPNFKKEVPEGVHHLVAFLSRSFHESVKNENSVVVRKLVIGNNPTDSLGIDIEAPTLIYSRPKGTYIGKDTEQVLLDFFVLNTKLAENGHKVMAKINGQEFTITEWGPHVIKGLPMGEVTIELQLVDANGELVPGPFNQVTRKVWLKEKAA